MARKGETSEDAWPKIEPFLDAITGWGIAGLSDTQIAQKLKIDPKTLRKYKKEKPELKKALDDGKDIADSNVVNATYKLAMGHMVTVRKAFKVKKAEYSNGYRINEKEEIVYHDEDVYIPPNALAQQFWLANRKKEDWKRKDEQAAPPTDEKGVVELPAVLPDNVTKLPKEKSG